MAALADVSRQYGLPLDPDSLVGDLSVGERQRIEIIRCLLQEPKLLIMDEPTAVLTPQEADQLFNVLERLAKEGCSILYISHRLEEVFELADRVSVLRDGTLVGTRNIKETNENELVSLMINRSIEQIYHKEQVPIGETLLETRHLSGKGFEDISLTVHRGEIVGLYGLIGAGRSEFAMSVFGRNPRTSGEILWKGQPVDIRTERQAIKLGIAMAPESRRDQGLNLNLQIGFNINLPIYDRLTHGITISNREEAQHADQQIRDLSIKTPSRCSLVSSMSGGNQQKVVIGKWLNHGADLFIFDEPTVGVDVGTKAEIYRLLAQLLKNGAGIILISSYLPEVYELADTLHVFRDGRLTGSNGFHQSTHEQVLAEAIGV